MKRDLKKTTQKLIICEGILFFLLLCWVVIIIMGKIGILPIEASHSDFYKAAVQRDGLSLSPEDMLLGKTVEFYIYLMMVDNFLLFMGLYLVVRGIYQTILSKKSRKLIFAGAFITLLSVWFQHGTVSLSSIWTNYSSIDMIISLIILPVPFIGYLLECTKEESRYWKEWFYGLCIIQLIDCIVFLISLKSYGELEMMSLVIVHFLMGLAAGSTIVYVIANYASKRIQMKWTEVMGLFALIMGFAVEMVFFYQQWLSYTGLPMRAAAIGFIICVLRQEFTEMIEETAEREKIREQLQEKKQKIFVSQIQPHFIYNTLGAIGHMIKNNPSAASKMVNDFSKYLRLNIRTLQQEELIDFSDELEHIRTYMNIEKARFGDDVKVEYKVREQRFQIPPLTVQPLVENAVKHGLRKKEEGGTVIIESSREKDYILIQVKDDGVGFATEKLDELERGDHIGLSNISFRLHMILEAELTIESEIGKGTTASIKIPTENLKED